MFTKIAIALAVVLATATGALAAAKKQTTNPEWSAYDGRAGYDMRLYQESERIHRNTYMHD